jgi:predicted RNase H-like HicB family nuclease
MNDGFFYPLGWHFSGVAQKLGVPTGARINVIFDDDARVFVATSKDVKGLVVEADTIEQLMTEANELIPMLLKQYPKVNLMADYHLTSRMMTA